MAQYFLASPLPADILVPVPLHVHRMRERGYNQSTLLARDLGHTLNIPLDEENLLRRKDTPPQARTPSADQRQRNVSGAFAMRSRKLKGKRVLLIDDVCTSGATLDSCARVLKRAGSASVWGFTLAKEI
ncbi:MAG: ComF family protein [Chloroflexi bacterium]|nr:ComF family protein [Chloroflexota bacterium]